MLVAVDQAPINFSKIIKNKARQLFLFEEFLYFCDYQNSFGTSKPTQIRNKNKFQDLKGNISTLFTCKPNFKFVFKNSERN